VEAWINTHRWRRFRDQAAGGSSSGAGSGGVSGAAGWMAAASTDGPAAAGSGAGELVATELLAGKAVGAEASGLGAGFAAGSPAATCMEGCTTGDVGTLGAGAVAAVRTSAGGSDGTVSGPSTCRANPEAKLPAARRARPITAIRVKRGVGARMASGSGAPRYVARSMPKQLAAELRRSQLHNGSSPGHAPRRTDDTGPMPKGRLAGVRTLPPRTPDNLLHLADRSSVGCV
jgi:hypothetical protein